jgi:poly(hydroxyalkanoate) depolymerase family esterase
MTAIDAWMSADMQAAIRLTREGHVAEATALLQRRFHGKRQSGGRLKAWPGPSVTDTSPPSIRHASQVLDVDPTTGAVNSAYDSISIASGTQAAPPIPRTFEKSRGFLDQINGKFLHPTARTGAPVPSGARFEEGIHVSAHGSRTYKLYVPSGLHAGQPVPLIVMLHGCTQSPDDFAAGTRMNTLAEEQIFLVAYPAQPASANAQKCWNWFSPGDQERDGGEPALIAGITRQIMRDYAVDSARIYVAGLSAGGAAAAIMGAAYPDLYAAVGVHSGLACGAARDLPSAFAAMRRGGAGTLRRASSEVTASDAAQTVPTIVFHADGDTTVHPSNSDHVLAQAGTTAGNLTTTVEHGEVANGGRKFTRTLYADFCGIAVLEQWIVHGGGHAWSGGSPDGSYTDPRGPDASRAMLRFFLDHPHAAPQA